MRRIAFCVVMLGSCASSSSTPRVTLEARPVARRPPKPETLCGHVMQEQRDAMMRAITDSRTASPSAWKDVSDEEIAKLVTHQGIGIACFLFPGGAWALEIVSHTLHPEYRSLEVTLAPAAYTDGHRVASTDEIHAGYGAMFTAASAALASDYDGDGVPELYVHTFEEGVEGGHTEEGALYTLTHGTVTKYAAAASLEDVGAPRDVDGDGRLDLPTSAGIRLVDRDTCEFPGEWKPADFIAHSRQDGTFSIDDDVAKRFARGWCPSAPAVVATPKDALCARLWVRTAADIAQARKAIACVPFDCQAYFDGRPQTSGATLDCNSRLDVFDAKVPFTLP